MIAIVLMMAGALSILKLPVSQYPNIAPPAIGIAVTYPGASAQTVQDTVVQVIEQQMNGLDGLEYISSESNSDGSMSITLTFRQGTNPDTAQVQVQNKLSLAQPLLPQEVQQQGIRVTKATKNFLIVAGFVSTDGTMTKDDLADYVASYVQDPISRTQGVGDFQLFGSQYAMRIWLNPDKLINYGLTTTDVVNAIKEQNVQVSSGQLGGLPAVRGQQLNATIIGPSRLQKPEDFGRILLKVNQDGSQVRLANVASIELGGQTYAIDSYFNGKPASGLAVKLAPGANALDTAQAVRDTINSLKPFFPPGMDVVYPYDTTPFVSLSIEEVFKTLAEAIVLVFLVMYLFLQNFRATIIPTLAVPVVLLGTFGVLAAFGYSINTLTMFGMVLAIGLLVDDAIVVVENVERVMAEEGLTPKQATRKSMTQITGALIGIAMVLAAVFIPMAFFGGSTGVIYRQFSITIVSSMVLSVIVAIVFTPALCATMLKPIPKGHHGAKRGFFGWFNRTFDRSTEGYANTVSCVLNRGKRLMLVYLAIVIAMAWMFTRIPTAFLPDEDQGILFAQIQTPSGATAERTKAVIDEATKYLLEEGRCHLGVRRQRLQLRRPWPERVHPVHQAARLGRTRRRQPEGPRRGRARQRPLPQDRARRHAVRGAAALGDGAGQRDRLRLHVDGPRRRGPRSCWPRATSCWAPRPRAGAAGRAPERHRGRAAVPARHRPREGARAGRGGVRHQQHAGHRLGFVLRQRFHRPRSREEGVRAGRRIRAHAARGPGEMVRAQQERRHGSVLGLLVCQLDLRPAEAEPLQRLAVLQHPGPGRAGLQLGRRDAGNGAPGRAAADRRGLRMDRHVVRRALVGRAGAGALCDLADRGVPVPGRAV